MTATLEGQHIREYRAPNKSARTMEFKPDPEFPFGEPGLRVYKSAPQGITILVRSVGSIARLRGKARNMTSHVTIDRQEAELLIDFLKEAIERFS